MHLIECDHLVYIVKALKLPSECFHHLRCALTVENIGVVHGVCPHCGHINNLLFDFSSYRFLTKSVSSKHIAVRLFVRNCWHTVFDNIVTLTCTSDLLHKGRIHYYENNKHYLFSYDVTTDAFAIDDLLRSKRVSKQLRIIWRDNRLMCSTTTPG